MSELLAEIATISPAATSPLQYRSLARRVANEAPELPPLRLVLLATYVTDFLDPFLVVEGCRSGYALDVARGGFAELEPALSRPTWADDGRPGVLLLHLRPEDLDQNVADRFYRSGGSRFTEVVDRIVDRLDACVALYREAHGGAPIFVANFALPAHTPLGLFDAGVRGSLTNRVHEANLRLTEWASERANVFVWDYAGLVASRGSSAWTDPRLWALARTAFGAEHHPWIAEHIVRSVTATLRPAAKCLVLDLDETLWGGAVGDDGLGGLELGEDHPGSAYRALQRVALGLRDRGVLLAVASKNDEDVATHAIEQHPEMLIRLEHLSAYRIGWGPKSAALREIAEELNIGVDALVFFDDNPVERAEVRRNAPEAHVVEVPPDPVAYASTLAGLDLFDAPGVTTEDLARAEAYTVERQRRSHRAEATSVEDFLTSLEMSATIGVLDDGSAKRVGQLVAKTNQFNLTVRRHTEAELRALAADGAHVCWLRLRDGFGDLGLIGVAVLHTVDDTAVIDSLVLSCRAANRGVEQALVSHLADVARQAGCARLVGEYIATDRNHVVAELYEALGFHAGDEDAGVRRFTLSLPEEDVAWPEWIARS